MDTHSPPPPTTTSPVKSPDPDPKPLPPPFTNGLLKRLKPRLLQPVVVVSYKECLKNHAASLGAHALDGCGEFMPSMTSSPSDPTSLKCAACGCHRNFHRRDPDGPPLQQHVIEYQPHHRHHPPPPPPPVQPVSSAVSPPDSPSPPPISSSYYPSAPHMLLALSSGLPAPPSEKLLTTQYSSVPIAGNLSGSGKKRFRTKFTQDQKEKMHELAERVGWKMQKKDEDVIVGICNEIGVDKGVFKVWMHNNKMTFGKKDSDSHHNDGSSGGGGGDGGVGGGGVDFFNINNNNNQQQQQQRQNDDVCGNVVTGTTTTNGSSSSS